MWGGYLGFFFGIRCLTKREDGQDLFEYALILAVLAAGVTASSQSMAVVLTTLFTTIISEFVSVLR
jgi:Flp pilus assembly pilin Flp